MLRRRGQVEALPRKLRSDEIRTLRTMLGNPPRADGPLFLGRAAAPISAQTLDHLMKGYGRAALIAPEKRHFLVLKHSLAIHLLEAGWSVPRVHAWLGHESLRTTTAYLKLVKIGPNRRDGETASHSTTGLAAFVPPPLAPQGEDSQPADSGQEEREEGTAEPQARVDLSAGPQPDFRPPDCGGLAEPVWDRCRASIMEGVRDDPAVLAVAWLRERAARVARWLDEARAPQAALGWSLPTPWPPVHRAEGGDPRAFVWTETLKPASGVEVATAIAKGFVRMRARQQEWKRSRRLLADAVQQNLPGLMPEAAETLRGCTEAEDERASEVAYAERLVSAVVQGGEQGFFGLMDEVPWRERVSSVVTTRLASLPDRWQWPGGGGLSKPSVMSKDTSAAEMTACELLGAGGIGLLGRFARAAGALDAWAFLPSASKVSGVASDKRTWVPRAPAPLSAPNPDGGPPEQGRVRVLTDLERARLFHGEPQPSGSAGAPGFQLPVGSVIVIPDDEPAYLRGRGWRISPERRLITWSASGEPGPVMDVGGSAPAGAGDNAPGSAWPWNGSALPLGGAVHSAGMRWSNVLGDGSLWDETPLEWEDRRDRLRSAVRARLASRQDLSPSEWRWAWWSLMGHCGSASDWRFGDEDWRWPAATNPYGESVVSDCTRYVAGPRTQNGEWTSPEHDALWMQFAGLRHANGSTDLLTQWLDEVRERATQRAADPVWQSAHEAAVRTMLGGRTAQEFWADERLAERSARDAEGGYREAVTAHRAWMRRHVRLAYVPDPCGTGPLDGPDAPVTAVSWTEEFSPEPFVVPAAMVIPMASDGQLHDFSTGDHSAVPSAEQVQARCFGASAPSGRPLQPGAPPGSSLPGGPSDEAAADTAALGLSTEAMEARWQTVFREAHALLLGGEVPPLWSGEADAGDVPLVEPGQSRPVWPQAAPDRPQPPQGRRVDRRASPAAFAGLAPEQGLFLQHALAGKSVLFTGPGGAGKTAVLRRFAELKALHDDGTYVAVVTPDAGSVLHGAADVFRPWDEAAVERSASRASGAPRSCLIIDEHSSATTAVLRLSDRFDQVILAGDPAQGTYGVASVAAGAWLMARNPVALGPSLLWRASSRGQFATLNALIYGGRHEAFGGAGQQANDDVRSHQADTGLGSALAIAARVVRYRGIGADATLAALVPSHAALLVVIDGVTRRLLRDGKLPQLLSPSRMAGVEADVLIADPGRVAGDERLAVLLAGRPRFRLDLIKGGSASFLDGMLSWTFEAGGPVVGVAGRLREALERSGAVVTHGRTHLATYDRRGSTPLRLFLFEGASVISAMSRQTAAGAKGWPAGLVSPADLYGNGAIERLVARA